MIQSLKQHSIYPFDPDVLEKLYKKWRKEKYERKPMDPEALAEEVSDRLIRILEEELERRLAQKTGKDL